MYTARPSGGGRRSGRLLLALSSIALMAGVGVLLAGWMVSPIERLSGPFGSLGLPRIGAPYGPAQHQLVATGAAPVLVAGAAVMLDGGGVRAVDLRTRRTYWRLSRPGHVTAESIWRVNDRLAAVIWSDRRLTVVNVATGRRWQLTLPDRGTAPAGLDVPAGSGAAVYGLAPFAGASALLVVVQPREVDAYAASGRPAWSYPLPRGQAVVAPADGAEPYDARPGVATVLLNVATDLPGGYRETHAVVLNALGRVTLWLSSPDPALELGGDRIGLSGSNALQVYDGLTGIRLYHLDVTDPPDATGDGSVLLAQNVALGTVTAYRATDGSVLWSDAFAGAGPQHTPGNGTGVLGLAIYGGRASVLQEYRSEYESCGPNYRLLTMDAAGAVVGIRPLPTLSCGVSNLQPSLVSGAAGVVILKDGSPILPGKGDRYVVEIG